ncbi:MAG: TonB-dependent receptor [Proteobacteria bacterium]|nr:TonB-dependent receptor [Pseudomonadota bacterium]
MNANTKRQRYLQIAIVCIGGVLSPDAMAGDDLQDHALPSTGEPPQLVDAARKAKTLDAVVVTGTHIRGVDKQTDEPLVRFDREQLLRTGLTNLGDIVQSLVVTGGESLGRKINNNASDNAGQQRVSLRSLGEQRTLVLVNGQRWAMAVDGAVDLSAIPVSLVDRIEVLKDGASAIYGSDAIGGVINIITRKHFDGAQLGLYAGVSEHGDGASRNLDFSYGHDGDRWQAAIGLEFGKDDPILASARAISSVPAPGLPLAATGSASSAYGVFSVPGWGRVVLIPGRPGTSPDDFRDFSAATDYDFNFAPYQYLLTPQERRAGFAQFRRDLSDTLAFSADALFDHRDSSQQIGPPSVSFSSRQYSGPQEFEVSADNLYNPFGVPVRTVRTRFVEAGPRRFAETVDTLRIHLGVDGSFQWGGHDWNWGVDATHTRSAQNGRSGPYADNDRLALAVGPSFLDASGAPRCGTPGNVIAGCVPIDLFTGPGRLTPAMLDYVDIFLDNRTVVRSDVLSAHIDGTPVRLPAGPLGFAAGAERRLERGQDLTDPLLAAGQANGTGVSILPTSGGYAVTEAYVEFNVPLLADKPLARRLDLDLATRWSNYSNFGSTDNSRIGLRWKPFRDLLIRGSWSEGFRAPSIQEAYGGAFNQNFGNIPDPCVTTDDYAPPPAVAARCAAQGVPVNVQQALEVDSTAGSNPALQPERSRSLGLGLVYSPSWWPGLDASLDWYRFKIRDAIGNPGVQSTLDACYDKGDPVACTRIDRNPDGSLKHILAIEQNLSGGIQTEGWDFALDWKRQTRIGQLALHWEAAYVSYWGEIDKPKTGAILPDGSIANGNVAGTVFSPNGAVWRLRSVATLAWQRETWGASITGRYYSPLKEDCSYVTHIADVVGDPSLRHLCSDPDFMQFGIDYPTNRIGATTYFDLEGHWDAPWKGRLTLGVRNAFDRDPPHAWSTTGSSSFLPEYDVPGRFWYLGYRQSF